MEAKNIFEVVSVDNELIPIGIMASISIDGGKTFSYESSGKGWKKEELNYTHWLKEIPTPQYCFSEDELKEFWDAARKNGLRERIFYYDDMEEYINSLNI